MHIKFLTHFFIILTLATSFLAGCATAKKIGFQKESSSASSEKAHSVSSSLSVVEPKTSEQQQAEKAAKIAELEEQAIMNPTMITSDYFRQMNENQASGKSVRLFGDSKKEKELEERLAMLENRLMGNPDRIKESGGLPVLRRKVVLLSLLGDLGLDVLALLPSALRRTDGIVPVDASVLLKILQEKGYAENDLTSTPVRREVAAIAGVHAFLMVYLPQTQLLTPGQLRVDVINAQDSMLIGSYVTRIEEFGEVAVKVSEDVIRGTEWSCRVVKREGNKIYLNAGRLTGLQVGDRLKITGRGNEIMDPVTGRSLGFAPGEVKGEVVVEELVSTDASAARLGPDANAQEGDTARIAGLAG